MEIVLIDNNLTQSEAKMLLRAFIMEKINFHKLRKLQPTNADPAWDQERIQELELTQRNLAREIKELPEVFPVECTVYLNEPLEEDDFYEDE